LKCIARFYNKCVYLISDKSFGEVVPAQDKLVDWKRGCRIQKREACGKEIVDGAPLELLDGMWC
jgi:hypothetical protein